MRSGNSASANGCVEFIKQAVTVLPQGHRMGLLWADAGFFEKRFLEYLESQELPYIIVARLTAVATQACDSSATVHNNRRPSAKKATKG